MKTFVILCEGLAECENLHSYRVNVENIKEAQGIADQLKGKYTAYPVPNHKEKELINYGFLSFRHLVKRNEEILSGDFGKRIADHYDITNERTAVIVKTMQKFTYFLFPKSLIC